MSALQLDLFSALEEAQHDLPAPCLYRSGARGIPARMAEFAAWQQDHGRFGSLLRAHAWTTGIRSDSTAATDRCQAATLAVDLRASDDFTYPLTCDCTTAVNDYQHRGACRGCAWEGPERADENAAAEDGLDHAWPGWREMAVVPSVPDQFGGTSRKRDEAAARWLEHVTSLYPAGWLEAGGPIRTLRRGPWGGRHVPVRTPFGGYDVGVPEQPGGET